MSKIVLDAEAFKVLASDTRLSILKALDERPKTVSELARELELNKATVFEHLKPLVAGELIKKQEREGRKWVYYALAWKGKSLLHPENTTVMVLLSLGILGSSAALTQLGNYLRWWGLGFLQGEEGASGDLAAPGPESAELADEDAAADSAAQSEPAEGGSDGSDDSADTATSDEAASDDAFRFYDDGSDSAAADESSDLGLGFLDDPGFWWFAVLFVLGAAALTAAQVIRHRARQR